MINRTTARMLCVIAAALAVIISPSGAWAQMSACSKPRVAVKLVDLFADKDTYEVLIRKYPFQTKEYWKERIESKVLEKLRANSPGAEIFPADSGSRHDYIIRYVVHVIGCGQKEKVGDLWSQKDICFWAHGTIYASDACGLEGEGFKSSSIQDKDVLSAVTLFAFGMGNLNTITAQHEQQSPIPPRGPRISISTEPKPVSPLDGERETTVEARVTNCRGEPVYDKVGKKYGVIAGPHETGRGRTTPPVRETPAFREGANMWRISPDPQGKVPLKYKLERGIKPGKEEITFTACGLDTRDETKQPIEIEGLEILVKPQKARVKPAEDTRIDIEFVKVSAKGERKPVAGRQIDLRIEGLKDGIVRPNDKVSTNGEGKASLTYHAGQGDKSVRIVASHKPQNFPDRAEGSAIVLVQEGKGDLGVQINGSLNWTGEDKSLQGTITTSFTINGTMSLKTKKHEGAYENYEIENLQLHYSHHARFYGKDTGKGCKLVMEVHGQGSAPIQEGRIVIRYPREAGRGSLRSRGELDVRLSSGALPTKWTTCNESRDKTTGIGVVLLDQRTPIVMNQKEFTGSRSFGITDVRGAFTLAAAQSIPFSFNDNESGSSSLPMQNDIEKILAEAGRSVAQMRNLATGIKSEGNDGRLTWRIIKIKKP